MELLFRRDSTSPITQQDTTQLRLNSRILYSLSETLLHPQRVKEQEEELLPP